MGILEIPGNLETESMKFRVQAHKGVQPYNPFSSLEPEEL